MASEKGIRAGKAFVEVFADNAKLVRGLRAAERQVKAFGRKVQDIGKSMMTLGALVAGPLVAATKYFSSYGDQVAKMSKRTGLSVEALSELRFVASQTGTEFESLELAFRKMQRSIYDAGRGLSTQKDALADLGLTYKDLAGLAPEEQFKILADRLGGVTDDTKQAAIAMSLFGRTGTNLIPMFEAGADGISELQQRARELGLTMSKEDAKAAEDFTDAMDEIVKSLKMAVFQIGGALAPAIQKLQGDILNAVKSVRAWVENNGELLVTVLKVAAGVAAFGAGALIIGKVTAAVGTLIGVVRGLATAFTFLLAHPVVAALAGIAVAATALGLAMRAAYSHTVELSDAMQDQLAAGDMIRRNDRERLQQLQQLAAKGRLNNEELQRATDILGQLSGRYGDLGIAVDSTTGKITGMATAQERLNAAMRKAAAMELDAAIYELRGNVIKLRQEAGSIAEEFYLTHKRPIETAGSTLRYSFERGVSEFLPMGELNELKEYKDLLKQITPLQMKLDAAMLRREALLQGGDAAVTGDARSPAGPPTKEEELGNVEDIAKARKDWMKKLHELRMQQIDDEFERERSQIMERYSEALLDKKNFGAADVIMKARDTELAGVDRRKQQREAEEAKKAAEEAERLRVAIEQGNQARRERVEELTLRKQYEGLDLERKMLDIEEKRALLAAKTAGERLDLVRQEYDLRRQILEAAAGAREVTEQAARANTLLTMDATALNRLGIGAGSSTDQKMLEKLEKIAQQTREMNDRLNDIAVFGGPTFA